MSQGSEGVSPERGGQDDWAVLNVTSMTSESVNSLARLTIFTLLGQAFLEDSRLLTLVISEMIGTPPNAI